MEIGESDNPALDCAADIRPDAARTRAKMRIKSAIELIQSALPGLGAGSPIHTSALNALRQLSKHLAAGQPTAGVQQTMLQDLLRRTNQNAMFQKMLGQRGAQGQESSPDMPAGQTPQIAQAPMPSTPLQGA